MAHKKNSPNGWDSVAQWYDGWVGKAGSDHHQKLAIPAIIDLLQPTADMHILDVGCGTGVLAPSISASGANYTGIDISRKLIDIAKQHHGKHGTFQKGDARKLHTFIPLESVDACAYLLSVQDMNPLDAVIASAARVLKTGGTIALLMTHPCFRIPRQSGWGYEKDKKLQYRRLDRYLSPLNIPMKQHKQGATISFHRPLQDYINTLGDYGLMVDKLDEITTYEDGKTRAEKRANAEFPLFMAVRARKLE